MSKLLTAVALAFVTAGTVAAQGTGTITVTVVDSVTNAPIAGAAVSIIDTPIGGLTGEDGRLTLVNVPVGEQTIRTGAEGFGVLTRVVRVNADETVLATMRVGAGSNFEPARAEQYWVNGAVVGRASSLAWDFNRYADSTYVYPALQYTTAWRQLQVEREAAQQARATNVRLTFHLIEADGFSGDDPEIQDVVTELRRIFRFDGYRLSAKSVLNAGLPAAGNEFSTSLSQQFTDVDGERYAIRVDLFARGTEVRIEVQLQHEGDYRLVNGSMVVDKQGAGRIIQASVNIQDGRSVVLGSANTVEDRGAFILVVTPTFEQ